MSIADELITRGWTQGTAEDDEGRVCLWGAALRSRGIAPLTYLDGDRPLMCDGLAAISAVCRVVDGSIGSWNDDPERTFDEVLRVAKEADEILDAS